MKKRKTYGKSSERRTDATKNRSKSTRAAEMFFMFIKVILRYSPYNIGEKELCRECLNIVIHIQPSCLLFADNKNDTMVFVRLVVIMALIVINNSRS
jgi:hypothetical protein